jgi:pyridoxine 5-phosphate synthase
LREDRRHILDRDVRLLMETSRTGLNLEMASGSEILGLACAWKPKQATIVPEKREEITTEGGLDLSSANARRGPQAALRELSKAGIRTALFIDPTEEVVRAAVDMGPDAVELHTGEYANTRGEERRSHLARINRAASLARKLSIDVHAGHGLTYENVTPVAAIPEIEELNIGHSIVSRAIFTGIGAATRDMVKVLRRARAPR